MVDEINADLWRDNRRRRKISLLLISLSVLLAFVIAGARPTGVVKTILMGILLVLSCAGIFGLNWTRREWFFLSKSEPKEPPSLWKL